MDKYLKELEGTRLMRIRTAIFLQLSGLTALTMLGWGAAYAIMPPSDMAPNPVVFATAGGITVALHTTDADPAHLRFEICGADITRIPAGLTIVLAFDAPIHQVILPQAYIGLVLDVQVTGQVAVVSLVRDPFLAPTPWRFVLGVAFEALPAAGRIAVGPSEAQTVRYQNGAPAANGPTRLTGGCLDLFAAL
jgi:hypothetical protein